MKRFLAVIISVCLVFSILSFNIVTVNAATYSYSTSWIDGYRFSVDTTNEIAAIECANPQFKRGEVVIPSTFDNYPITIICASAFSDCNQITSIIIPDSVTVIEESAFYNCGATTVSIPDSVKVIKKSTFKFCFNLTKITLPVTVTNIDDDAFDGCSELTDVWYTGSQTDRENIVIGSFNSYLKKATWHYNSCPIGAPHAYDNDCDKLCNGCGKERTVSGHVYDNDCDTVCNICNGIRSITHTYDNDCDTQCNVCNEVRVITHSYGEWETAKKATCTESGTKVRKCSVCSKTETENITALGHNISSEWTVDKDATCTVAGTKSYHCTKCSHTEQTTTILPKGHSWGAWTVEKAATVTTEGVSARKCKECNLKETQTIAKLADDGHIHSFGEWKITKAATCKEKGKAVRTCSICKDTESKEILATGHQVGEWEEISATCIKDGVRNRKCVLCGEEEQIKIEALGHDFEDSVIVKEPSDTEDGVKKGVCKRCGEEITEKIPMLLEKREEKETSNSTPKINAEGRGNSKKNDKLWVLWIAIAIVMIAGIGIGAYLITKKRKANIN